VVKEVFPKLQDGSDGAWRWSKDKVTREIERIEWKSKGNGWTPYFRIYADGSEGRPPETIFYNTDVGSSRTSKKEIKSLFPEGSPFDTPKPIGLLDRILRITTNKKSLVLDSFAGSATTAHAVLALNRRDGGTRKFILVECEDYADTLTAERVRRVVKGFTFDEIQREELMREPLSWAKLQKAATLVEKAESVAQLEGARFDKVTKTVEDGALLVIGEKKIADKTDGLGGSFTYCELGPEMSIDKLLTDGLPSFEALAKYVYFTATGGTLTELPKGKAAANGFISETGLYRVHLHYKQDKVWLQSNDAALTETLLDVMIAANTAKKKLLVFAAAKFMGQRELTKLGVDFCQLPYAIHRILGE